MSGGLRFEVLGPVRAWRDDVEVELGPPRQRAALGFLLLRNGIPASHDQMISALWGEDAPDTAVATVRSYVSRLRRRLPNGVIESIGGGYALPVAPQALDFTDFLRRVTLARQAQRVGDLVTEAAELRAALTLWKGTPLAGVHGQYADCERTRLTEMRLAAIEDMATAGLELGRYAEAAADLAAAVAEEPLRERARELLMLALYRSGRQAEALAVYEQAQRLFADKLGPDPGPALQAMRQRILAADLSIVARPTPMPPDEHPDGEQVSTTDTGPAPLAAAPAVTPRQLPPGPAWFTGRNLELAALTAALDTTAAANTVVLSVLAGAGGTGKTWLALHWAHQQLDRFPDGQLFVDLRGFSADGAPMSPQTAVHSFLVALGVQPDRIPADLDGQTALYRSLVAEKRMLIVLDNAATAEQTVPLLPGTNTCAVLVTSRRTLSALIHHHGARHLPVPVLGEDEAHALLSHRLGRQRVASEPAAVQQMLRLSGRYPLALSIMAGRAHTLAHLPLAEFAAELEDLGLEALDDTDPTASLPTVLSWSLHGLSTEQRMVFALLGVAPGADIGLPAAASLIALPLPRARAVLRELEQASLLDQQVHGRYSMHDLIRAYATTTAHQDLTEQVRESALRRALAFYTHTAHTADHLLDPHRRPIQLDPATPGAHPQPLPDMPAALAWFDTEHPNLLAAQHTATIHHWHHTVWQLAWVLTTFHHWRGYRRDRLAVWQAALDAAEHLSDTTIRIRAYRLLGYACADLEHHEEAVGHLQQALTLAEHLADPIEQAQAHHALASAWERRGDDRQALAHATRSLDLFRAVEQPVREAGALNEVGWHAARLGDYDTARAHCQAALTLYRRHHDPAGEAETLDSLGYIAHHTGQHQQAVHHYQQALTLRRGLGNTYYSADTLDHLGHPCVALGEQERARRVWREALELYREQGRSADAERLQRQLDDLDNAGDTGSQ